MRREIKFRAKVSEEMKELYQLITYPDTDFVYGDLHLKCNHPHIHVDSRSKYWIDIDTIGQFTGLYDKNGKEIYEGDIVKWTFFFYIGSEVQKDLVGIIKWYQGGFIFDVIKHDIEEAGFYGISDLSTDTESDCEIIGNIYDNPELMKGREETE